ncbi:hypothetical protein BDA96_03G177100 [Sorghum bicolor]|uniref:DNA2/NAM7 helicase-like C-terminal domain-containing protein n=1 Tax=Sorghum bicolor TaxID=4558 RepID=A0A921UQA6_SORBI|nr:hypothetical protein BDA96_03G177100 [Sorghum bicolor]
MHPFISQFPNQMFYDGKIIDGPNVEDYNNTYLDGHMYGTYSFIHVEDGFEENSNQGSKNIVEAAVVANIVGRLVEEYHELIANLSMELSDRTKKLRKTCNNRLRKTCNKRRTAVASNHGC